MQGTVVFICGATGDVCAARFRRVSRLRSECDSFVRLSASDGGPGDWLRTLRTLKEKFRTVSRGRPGPLRWVIPAEHVLLRALKLPRASRAQRDRVAKFEASHAFPVDLGELSWAWWAPKGAPAWLAATAHSRLAALEAAARRSGWTWAGGAPEPLLWWRGALRAGMHAGGIDGVVWKGGARTVMLLWSSDRLQLHVVGGTNFDRPETLAGTLQRALRTIGLAWDGDRPVRLLAAGDTDERSFGSTVDRDYRLEWIRMDAEPMPAALVRAGIDESDWARWSPMFRGLSLDPAVENPPWLISPDPIARRWKRRIRRHAAGCLVAVASILAPATVYAIKRGGETVAPSHASSSSLWIDPAVAEAPFWRDWVARAGDPVSGLDVLGRALGEIAGDGWESLRYTAAYSDPGGAAEWRLRARLRSHDGHEDDPDAYFRRLKDMVEHLSRQSSDLRIEIEAVEWGMDSVLRFELAIRCRKEAR